MDSFRWLFGGYNQWVIIGIGFVVVMQLLNMDNLTYLNGSSTITTILLRQRLYLVI